jgi:hypothetical protein
MTDLPDDALVSATAEVAVSTFRGPSTTDRTDDPFLSADPLLSAVDEKRGCVSDDALASATATVAVSPSWDPSIDCTDDPLISAVDEKIGCVSDDSPATAFDDRENSLINPSLLCSTEKPTFVLPRHNTFKAINSQVYL